MFTVNICCQWRYLEKQASPQPAAISTKNLYMSQDDLLRSMNDIRQSLVDDMKNRRLEVNEAARRVNTYVEKVDVIRDLIIREGQ